MPVSPDMARVVAREVRRVYQDAEDATLARIARAVAAGVDTPDGAVTDAARFQEVLAAIDRTLARMDEAAPALFDKAVASAYQQGATAAGAEALAAGISADRTLGGAQASRAVQALVEDNIAAVTGQRPRLLRSVRDVYQAVTAETVGPMLAGVDTRRDAARSALRRYADRGVLGFTDRAGRRWDLASYAEMSARTTAGQAAVQGHTAQLRDLGMDLVKVSSSPESCDECGPWQGRVLSLTGGTTGRLADGTTVAGTIDYARSQGLLHPNCSHSVGLYVPGHSRKAEHVPADPDVYKTRQRQRAYERQVRGWKRRALIDAELYGKDDPRTVATRRRLRARQAEFKAWRDANGRKDLAYRTSLTAR